MNCPTRTDDTSRHPHWNQSPPSLSASTRADLNHIANLREQRRLPPDYIEEDKDGRSDGEDAVLPLEEAPNCYKKTESCSPSIRVGQTESARSSTIAAPEGKIPRNRILRTAKRLRDILFKYAQFVGPGFLIAVAYIDPGNYSTDIGAGAATKFSLLFIVLMSNLFAIFLQSLCIKLGNVTGVDLAVNCRKHLPRWMTISLYILAEAAIIATDIAEVIGSAIALNLLLHIPLVAGCVITVLDTLVILFFYNPNGSMTHVRIFEYFVMALVFGVMVCFSIQLSFIRNTSAGEVFRGYLPSSKVMEGDGVYLSCGILGATVMPHSLFLGSGICQSRLRQFDTNASNVRPATGSQSSTEDESKYTPSISSIRSCLKYSIVELATSLFTFALFINSAILIVAGASLSNNPSASNANLFAIHDLLSHTLAPAAGTIFALALLLSGTSAGIVCTIAGQMVSEGMLNWTIKPWKRRLVTRSISITPSVIIAAAVGKVGLDRALVASQVVLSVILPFVATPLLYFTCKTQIMTVTRERNEDENGRQDEGDENGRLQAVSMRNGWVVTILAVLIWLVLVIMNVALLVLVGLGKD